MSLLDDVRLGVQLGMLSRSEGREILLENTYGGGYDSAETWQSLCFFVLLVCGACLGLGLELLIPTLY